MTSSEVDAVIKKSDVEMDIEVAFPFLEVKEDKDNNDCCSCNCLSPNPCSCTTPCCIGKKCSYKMNRLQLALIILLSSLLIIFVILGIIPFDEAVQPIRPLTSGLKSAIRVNIKSTRVLLYGDSQWGIVERHHHLTKKIQAYLPEYPMNFTVVGDLGVRALDLEDRLQRYKYLKPHLVLINLDSDCSNVNEDVMSIQERTSVRDNYRGNLSTVVSFWLNTGALVALGGPGLLGEGPLKPLHVARFKNKDVMLDAYVEINKEISAAYKIPFMDFRATLRSKVPWWRFYYNGYVTKGKNKHDCVFYHLFI
jgi:hypothetical protein